MKRTPFTRKPPNKPPGQGTGGKLGHGGGGAGAAREAAKRAAVNALKRAKRAADKAGVELSDWEGEFLGSVAERIEKFGRAFADPDKGAMGAPMSAMQGRKLREIQAKVKGEPRFPNRRSGKND